MKQIAIVGAGGGLGRAITSALLNQGDKVVALGRTDPGDARITHFYPIDAATADWGLAFETVEEESRAALDAVIFVAGDAVFGKTAMIPTDRARHVFELNFWGCTGAARAAAEYWTARNHPGKFIAVLSIVARRAVPFEAYYSASKAAAARFLECLQLEYAHRNIDIVSAFPGMLKTPFRRRADWYGLNPDTSDAGADVNATARAILKLLNGSRRTRVIGWRERTIDLADRIFPGLYDRTVLRFRTQKLLK